MSLLNSFEFELSYTDGEAETGGDLEGTWPLHTSPTMTVMRMRLQRGCRFR